MQFSKENLHHAHLCIGEKEQVKGSVLSFVEDELGFDIKGNPDLRIEDYVGFGVNDARRINESQLKKSILGDKMIFIITLDSITIEAQNSLLKMLEEPAEGTHFFIITTSKDIFIPTLISRVEVVHVESTNDDEREEFVKTFVASSSVDRIKMLKNIIEEKDKGAGVNLLVSLEKYFYNESVEENKDRLETISFCRRYLNDRGASLKMLMEYLAINV